MVVGIVVRENGMNMNGSHSKCFSNVRQTMLGHRLTVSVGMYGWWVLAAVVGLGCAYVKVICHVSMRSRVFSHHQQALMTKQFEGQSCIKFGAQVVAYLIVQLLAVLDIQSSTAPRVLKLLEGRSLWLERL